MVTNSIAAIGFVLAFAVPLERRFDTRLITIVSVLIGLAMSGACYIWPSWITYNLLAIAIGSLIGNVYTVTKMRYLVCGLIGIALYDAIAVFGTRMMQDMAFGLGSFKPGMVVLIPRDLFTLSPPDYANTIGILGLGDIVFSCCAVLLAARYRLHWWAIGGYAIGLMLAQFGIFMFARAMPAMIYLSPVLLCSIYLGAWYRGTQLRW
jgi:presenilin-like A22 family membrane protease